MKRVKYTAAFAALLVLGSSSLALAGPKPGARALVDCNMTATGMTVTVNAKTKGGGKPEPVGETAPIFVILDQKVGHNYIGLRTVQTWVTQTLPVTARFELCTAAGSVVNPLATALRGRGVVWVKDVGFVSNECSPSKPPSC